MYEGLVYIQRVLESGDIAGFFSEWLVGSVAMRLIILAGAHRRPQNKQWTAHFKSEESAERFSLTIA